MGRGWGGVGGHQDGGRWVDAWKVPRWGLGVAWRARGEGGEGSVTTSGSLALYSSAGFFLLLRLRCPLESESAMCTFSPELLLP